MNTITYNQYDQEYTIKFQPKDFAFVQVIKCRSLHIALLKANDIYEQYGIIITCSF